MNIATGAAGSSPRMWGTPGHSTICRQFVRFIPTHVGNTSTNAGRPQGGAVHPHACGEHGQTHPEHLVMTGSSPRMWGTLEYGQHISGGIRFIPTHVGNTPTFFTCEARLPVHPHACGEHLGSIQVYKLDGGSSPRMWGTRRGDQSAPAAIRFIPTHVGNTRRWFGEWDDETVHPHACGEHWTAWNEPLAQTGSSPRMWGTPGAPESHFPGGRFIPTHVGNTRHGPGSATVEAVHPHACGEHSSRVFSIGTDIGSSPRMWGTPPLAPTQLRYGRFIPTHVGNTLSATTLYPLGSVHPHACGEHRKRSAHQGPDHGSSPRMWGTLERQAPRCFVVRFIPTHVGNTPILSN